MNASRTLGSRARRIAAATAGLGVAALLAAPGAMAAYNDVAPPADTQVLGVKHSAPAAPAATVAVASASASASASDSLAYTGAEVGAVGAAGVALVAGGALLVRGSRRRGALTAA